MTPSYRAGWIAAAAGGDDRCSGGSAAKQREYRAGHAAYIAAQAPLRATVPCWICNGRGNHGHGVRCSTCGGTGREAI